MIIIKLMGGLGNQLFQYAYGRAFSLDKNEKMKIDTTWHKGRLNRPYLLDHFNIAGGKTSWFDSLFHKKIEDTTGAWHSEKYFKKYADIIRKELTLKNSLGEKSQRIFNQIQGANSVSIHLRGTDYVHGNKSSFHGTPSPEYYEKSVELIKQKVSDPHFFIFTDDIPWAKQHITFPEPHTLVSISANPPQEELMLMSACKHNIIANSTFSWWAAWLNGNMEKIVIAPSRWFADENANASLILPPSWTKI